MKFVSDIGGTTTQNKISFSKVSKAASVSAQNALLDLAIKRGELKNDAALSRALEVAPPVISKIRHGGLTVGATLAMSMHEVIKIEIAEITEVLAT